MSKPEETHRPRSQTAKSRSPAKSPILRFAPAAWAKLLCWRDLDRDSFRDLDFCGVGISQVADPLLIEDLRLLSRSPSAGASALDDGATAAIRAEDIARELPDERLARIWIRTHLESSARPTATEEAMFERLFGAAAWSVMFVAARGGATYARVHYRIGPGGAWSIPVVGGELLVPAVAGRVARQRESSESVDIEPQFEVDDAGLRPEDWPVTM